jgi:hypothetical protein
VSFEIAKALAQARSYGSCEGCRAFRDLDPHHRMTRGIGGVHRIASDVSNDPRNLLMLCRTCHDLTLSDAAGCMAVGWVVERRAGVDPREVPAKIHTVNGYGWWYLTEAGGYEWADDLNMDPFYELSYDAQALPDGLRCQEPTCPDFGSPDFGEGTCPAEHAEPRKIKNQEEDTA